jgi:hypothetical protein
MAGGSMSLVGRKVKHNYSENRRMRIGDGEKMPGAWCTSQPLKKVPPQLFLDL